MQLKAGIHIGWMKSLRTFHPDILQRIVTGDLLCGFRNQRFMVVTASQKADIGESVALSVPG